MNADLVGETNWVEYYDEESEQPYYYDRHTKQTQYEEPEEYTEWWNSEIDKYLKASTTWRRQKDEKRGKYFYFNKSTKKSQWEVPSEQLEYETFLKQVNVDRMQADSPYDGGAEDEPSGSEGYQSPAELYDNGDMDNGEGTPAYESGLGLGMDMSSQPSLQRGFSSSSYRSEEGTGQDWGGGEEDDDHSLPTGHTADKEAETQRALAAALSTLSSRDAIMEPTIKRTVETYMSLAHDPVTVVRCLTQGYTGYAQMIHIVCSWIDKAYTDTAVSFNADEFVGDEMASTIKTKFNKVWGGGVM